MSNFSVEVPGSTSPTGHGDPETRTPAGESFLVEVPGSTSPTGHGDPGTRTPAGESFLVEVPGSTSPAGHHKTYRLESSGIYTGEAPDQRHVGHQKPLTRSSRQLLGSHVNGRSLEPATVNYCKIE